MLNHNFCVAHQFPGDNASQADDLTLKLESDSKNNMGLNPSSKPMSAENQENLSISKVPNCNASNRGTMFDLNVKPQKNNGEGSNHQVSSCLSSSGSPLLICLESQPLLHIHVSHMKQVDLNFLFESTKALKHVLFQKQSPYIFNRYYILYIISNKNLFICRN